MKTLPYAWTTYRLRVPVSVSSAQLKLVFDAVLLLELQFNNLDQANLLSITISLHNY